MVEDEIAKMRALAEVSSDAQLAEKLGYTRGAVTQWRRRNYIPEKAQRRLQEVITPPKATPANPSDRGVSLMDGPIHPEEIKARIRIRYGTIQRFEREKGLSQGAVSQVINTGLAWHTAAKSIADELDIPLHRVSAHYYKKLCLSPISRNQQAAHRINAEAR
ncbi:MAG: helix-turn-helix domain-containing protein [Sphingobium sp.]|uniref:helix-turn-helix domain-containing protein n=1 Tax=Sphingobium sp. TaxID=1912891 RepID=UPI003BB1ED9C